jgi:hypothetical protein
MSEVDRLSNSGLYPALPIADKRNRKDGPAGQPPERQPKSPEGAAAQSPDKNQPRPPKSLIDEYA